MRPLHEQFNTKRTPQTLPIPGRHMVRNNAGGYGFELDKWAKLDRFLIIGTEGGTFYVNEAKLTYQNAQNVLACIKEDGLRVVNRIVEVSDQGLAAKNDYALYALALAMTFGEKKWEPGGAHTVAAAFTAPQEPPPGFVRADVTRQAAYGALSKVARTPTHLFMFLNYVLSMRGWSRGLRGAVRRWYEKYTALNLAYAMTKYQNRHGYSHRDAMLLCRYKPPTPAHNEVVKTILELKGEPPIPRKVESDWSDLDEKTRKYLLAWKAVNSAEAKDRPHDVVKLIQRQRLTPEVIPSDLKKRAEVWGALLGEDGSVMRANALLRNLATLTRVGALSPFSKTTEGVVERLKDPEFARGARIHPLAALMAKMTYKSGRGFRSDSTWQPISAISGALEQTFYNAFQNVEPTGKRIVYAIDYSYSMSGHSNGVGGVPGLTASMAAGCLAMACARTEKQFEAWGFDHNLYGLPITSESSLNEVVEICSGRGGGTDASLPMGYALQKKLEVDAFVLVTDNETWAGNRHPIQALNEYRMKVGIPAKMVVISMTATNSSIGDPQDGGVLDVVGLSADTPRLVNDFIRG